MVQGNKRIIPSNSVLPVAAIGIGAALLVFGAAMVVGPRQALAKPEFAAQTGLPCGQCHVNPAGSGKLKSFGEKFKANGFKLPGKK